MNKPRDQAIDRAAVRDILDGAAELSGDQRRRLLDDQCGDDPALRAEVESLLAALDGADGLLDDPTGCTDVSAAGAHRDPSARRSEDAGTRIGRYKLLQQIGEGGCGVVFMAEQEHPVRRTVALKIIKLGMDTRQVVARFEAERQALALMDHPNIAKVLDAGSTETGGPYFVMELVHGSSITAYCDKHRMAPGQRLELFVQVCQAVQHAHSKGIIHRDIKPTNVLVTVAEDGRPVPKVIDFGVAKATLGQRLTDRTLFTEFRQLIGTPLYMSPEQAESDGVDIDTRSDVYSLGVLLYELLTGATPFNKDLLGSAAYDEVRRIIREEEPARPSTRLSTLAGDALTAVASSRQTDPKRLGELVRGELDWIVMRALEKDRSRRYETASALARDVERYLSDEPVEACPPSRAYRLRKFVRRNKGPVSAGAAVLSALVLGLALATAFYVRAERQRREAQTQATIAEAVSQFLSDMLGSADPRKSLGDKLTVLQATEAAIKELDAGELRDQPLVEAAVRATIGQSLIDLGRFDVAEPNLRRSLELSRRAGDDRNPSLAASLQGLAYVLQTKGRTAQAESLAREALAIRRRNLGPRHPRTTQSLILLAVVFQAQGKSAEAEPLLREALAPHPTALPAGHPDVTHTLSTLAGVLHVQGKLDAAEALYREVMSARRNTLPSTHPDLAQSLSNLAGLLHGKGRPADAEPLCTEALGIYRKALPPAHPSIAGCANLLAEVLRDQGKLAAAEPLLREALGIYRQTLPAEHPDIATCLTALASVLQSQGRLADAEPLAREAVAINRRSRPPGHWATAHGLNHLATLLLSRRKPAEAETLAREAMEINRRAPAAEDLNDAWSLNNLAEALKAQNKVAEAEPLHREALEIHRKVLPRGNPKLVDALTYLGGTLSEQGKSAEAEPLYREALEIESNTYGPAGGRTSWLASRLATVLDELDRRDEADALRRGKRTDQPATRGSRPGTTATFPPIRSSRPS